MIDTNRNIGDRVRYIDDVPELGASKGDEGVIVGVDPDDDVMTYKVIFTNASQGYWHLNSRIELVGQETLCGWQDRALKAEAELMELKAALKTLSGE